MSTAIEWADETWNPVVGCMKVSAGCEHCYAIRTAYRLEHAFKQADYQGLTRKLPDGSVNWTGAVRCLPDRLRDPLTWREPRRVFVNSMSDLFHEDVPDAFIAQVFAVMALTPRHTYQVLTKRPERMHRLLSSRALDGFAGAVTDAGLDLVGPPWSFLKGVGEPREPHNWPPQNVWLGVSVEDQRAADERIPLLLQTPAAVRFLSCEPLLGPVDLDYFVWERLPLEKWSAAALESGARECVRRAKALHWVIAGGESGPNARPMQREWATSLRDQCQAGSVPYFFKQWGGRTPKAGGRDLDGRTWDEYPAQRVEAPA